MKTDLSKVKFSNGTTLDNLTLRDTQRVLQKVSLRDCPKQILIKKYLQMYHRRRFRFPSKQMTGHMISITKETPCTTHPNKRPVIISN